MFKIILSDWLTSRSWCRCINSVFSLEVSDGYLVPVYNTESLEILYKSTSELANMYLTGDKSNFNYIVLNLDGKDFIQFSYTGNTPVVKNILGNFYVSSYGDRGGHIGINGHIINFQYEAVSNSLNIIVDGFLLASIESIRRLSGLYDDSVIVWRSNNKIQVGVDLTLFKLDDPLYIGTRLLLLFVFNETNMSFEDYILSGYFKWVIHKQSTLFAKFSILGVNCNIFNGFFGNKLTETSWK